MVGVELIGTWDLRRSVADLRAGSTGSVSGTLSIATAGDRLGWYENGTLTWAGRTVPVSRTTYLVDLDGEAWMTFVDGRPFHPWRPGLPVEHLCGEDRYLGRLDVTADVIRTTWRVTGPAKDQLLETEARRRV